jgi:hypothetical protein
MASSSKGREQESALSKEAAVATEAAGKADPLEDLERDKVTRLYNWATGKSGPVDVRAMPDDVAVPLYQAAKEKHDAGRIGKGLAFSENANPNFAAALDKEGDLERDLNASGMLEGHVDDVLGNLDARLMGLASMGNSRRGAAADRANERYTSFLNRPARPSFLSQLALSAVGGLSANAGLFGGGGGGAGKAAGMAGTFGKVMI